MWTNRLSVAPFSIIILALQNRIYFAEKLLEDIKNARIISKPFVDETVTEIAIDVKRRIAGADIILAIIDEKSNNSFSAKYILFCKANM